MANVLFKITNIIEVGNEQWHIITSSQPLNFLLARKVISDISEDTLYISKIGRAD